MHWVWNAVSGNGRQIMKMMVKMQEVLSGAIDWILKQLRTSRIFSLRKVILYHVQLLLAKTWRSASARKASKSCMTVTRDVLAGRSVWANSGKCTLSALWQWTDTIFSTVCANIVSTSSLFYEHYRWWQIPIEFHLARIPSTRSQKPLYAPTYLNAWRGTVISVVQRS